MSGFTVFVDDQCVLLVDSMDDKPLSFPDGTYFLRTIEIDGIEHQISLYIENVEIKA